MDLIFIYGPPAAGKLTVARELARLTGYRLWDNHVSLDCVRPVFDFGSASLDKLVHGIRRMMMQEAAEQGVNLITTFIYADPEDVQYVDEFWRPYEERGGRVCPVQLTATMEQLEARIGLPSRVRSAKANVRGAPEELLRALRPIYADPGTRVPSSRYVGG